MALPSISDLNAMGWTYNGAPFVEQDTITDLTSPGHMGVTYNGEPVTFNYSVQVTPILVSRTILSRAIHAGGMGIKKPHLP